MAPAAPVRGGFDHRTRSEQIVSRHAALWLPVDLLVLYSCYPVNTHAKVVYTVSALVPLCGLPFPGALREFVVFIQLVGFSAQSA